MKEMTLKITGMSCQHCVNAVMEALKGVPGVTPTSVDIGAAKLTYDPEQATPEQIVDAVTEEGYQVTVR